MQTTGADFNVSARGDNQPRANKMLVMVNGRSIFVDAQANVFWKAIPVTLPEIKRIEVLKGPASAIYGFNAFDGVINIITKSPGGNERHYAPIRRRRTRDDQQVQRFMPGQSENSGIVSQSATIKTHSGGTETP